MTAPYLERFLAAGAVEVAPDILQPAEVLLDLYGEDIRARAYVTHDPERGEMMLRPDFTVPVVRRHMANGAEPARYAYAGPVFRRQAAGSARPREYAQVGYELFDRADPARADAEVFALISEALAAAPVTPVTGDIGILKAAIAGLSTSAPRRAALARHIWRRSRFAALLGRFAGQGVVPDGRAEMLAGMAQIGADAMISHAGPVTGTRSAQAVRDRLARLQADADVPPIPAAEVAALDALLTLETTAEAAYDALRAIAKGFTAVAAAVERLGNRLDALRAAGIDTATLPYRGGYGRGSMEYYDGFVFGFYQGGAAGPPVASGGRYDALTELLGQGQAIPAVGGVIRPALVEAALQ